MRFVILPSNRSTSLYSHFLLIACYHFNSISDMLSFMLYNRHLNHDDSVFLKTNFTHLLLSWCLSAAKYKCDLSEQIENYMIISKWAGSITWLGLWMWHTNSHLSVIGWVMTTEYQMRIRVFCWCEVATREKEKCIHYSCGFSPLTLVPALLSVHRYWGTGCGRCYSHASQQGLSSLFHCWSHSHCRTAWLLTTL